MNDCDRKIAELEQRVRDSGDWDEWFTERAKLLPPPPPAAKFEVGWFVLSTRGEWHQAFEIMERKCKSGCWQYRLQGEDGGTSWYNEADLRLMTDAECGRRERGDQGGESR